MIAAAFATAAVWAFVLVLLVWLAVRWHARSFRIGDRVLVTRGAAWSENAEGCTGEIIDIDSQGPRYRVRLDSPIKYRGDGRDLQAVWVHGVSRTRLRLVRPRLSRSERVAHERPRITAGR